MNVCQLDILCLLIIIITGIMFISKTVESPPTPAAVNKKLQKSFVEIFGEGWNEEEKQQQQQQMKMRMTKEDIVGKTEQDSTAKEKPIQHHQQQQQHNHQQKMKTNCRPSFFSDGQKRKIVREFWTIKEKIKQQNGRKYSKEQWAKINELLPKKLGTNRTTINIWANQFGMQQEAMDQRRTTTTRRRRAMMCQYWEMKRNEPTASDTQIAKALKMSRDCIRRWKKQFRAEPMFRETEMHIKQQLSVGDGRKREIVRQFRTIKELIQQNKRTYSSERWTNIETLLAKKLGTNRDKIYQWIREMGMGQRQMRTSEERLAIMKRYWEMKKSKPNISDTKIAKALQIDRGSIRKWKDRMEELERCQKAKNETKVAVMKRYWEMKRNQPSISDRKIAKALQIGRKNIAKWKDQFGRENNTF